MKFPTKTYLRKISKLSKEELMDALVEEAQMRSFFENKTRQLQEQLYLIYDELNGFSKKINKMVGD